MMAIVTTAGLLSIRVALGEDGIEIMIQEEAAVLAAEHLHVLACLATAHVPVPAPGEEGAEPDVPRNGCIPAISAIVRNIPPKMISKKKRWAIADE